MKKIVVTLERLVNGKDVNEIMDRITEYLAGAIELMYEIDEYEISVEDAGCGK